MKRRALLLWAASPALAQAEVDANSATRAQLESVPGLGPALVQRLLAARPFKDWADLMKRVPGIRSASARKLSDAGLRVAGQAYWGASQKTELHSRASCPQPRRPFGRAAVEPSDEARRVIDPPVAGLGVRGAMEK